MLNHVEKIDQIITTFIIPFGWKTLGAFAVWFLGGVLIRTTQKILRVALNRRRIDSTLTSYASTATGAGLKILLIVTILGIFGIETTSFSALLAAAGVAVGIAWSGLLSNFAAGIFLILLRPFKVGDTINAAGISGTVKEIGLFATAIDTPECLRVFVGNNKLFSENILNYNANPYRLAIYKVQIASSVVPKEAIERFKAVLETLPKVMNSPAISGEIIELNPAGTVIQFKAPCQHSDYAEVLSEGYQLIHHATKQANYPKVENQLILLQK